MKPHIPKGGFFVIKDVSLDLNKVQHSLKQEGNKTTLIQEQALLLSANSEFESQGLWENEAFVVAYDALLTNTKDLTGNQKTNPGQVIADLYCKEGPPFINKLKGAFGFALWDKTKCILLIATDYFGIRPVVYTATSGGVAAGSRIQYIKKLKDLKTSIFNEAIFHYLFFSAIPSPVTIYKEVKKLEPGKYLIRQNEQTQLQTYYDIVYQPDYSHSEAFWIKEIPARLQKSFHHFGESTDQTKTGCFLSGGTDSSSLVGYCAQYFKDPVQTFSIGFNEEQYNEISFANIAAQHFKTKQHEYFVTPDDVMDLIYALPQIYDEPFGNASVIPAYYCAKLAGKNHINVLYGGDGGDEIFGGNERYVTNLVFEAYSKIPGLFRKLVLEPLVRSFPFIPLVHRAGRYIRRANIPNPERFYSYNMLYELSLDDMFNKDFLSAIDSNCFLSLANMHFTNAHAEHITDKLLYLDMKFTITDNDLRKVTQMVESAGIQVQYPFLDKDLVDFTATIPPELKVKWGKNRYIFKQAMKGFLPDEIINKSKHGMGLPVTPWFKKDKKMSNFLYDTLFSGQTEISEYVKPEFIHLMQIEFEKDGTNFYGDNLWIFLILEMWLKFSNDKSNS